MKPAAFDYYRPATVDDAVAALGLLGCGEGAGRRPEPYPRDELPARSA